MKLKKKYVSAGKDKTLVAWDFDERLYKKMAFISKDIFKNHNIKVTLPRSEWPHLSAVYVLADLSQKERDQFSMAADMFKPEFKFKQFALFKGMTSYFFCAEYHVPTQFTEFMKFAGDICGHDRIQRFSEDRPHVSLWEVANSDVHQITESVIAEIAAHTKPFQRPFIPEKVSFWDDFQITRIDQLSSHFIGKSFKEKLAAKYILFSEKSPYH